jgi:hypothetical protein
MQGDIMDSKLNGIHERKCMLRSYDKKISMVWDIAAIQKDIEKMNFSIELKNVLNLSEKTGGTQLIK